MKEKINELIPNAINAIYASKIADSNGSVKKEFNGYIASIGASIIQAGLLPTLAFFKNSSGKNADSHLLLYAILLLIKPQSSTQADLITYVIDETKSGTAQNNTYSNTNLDKDKLGFIEEEIMDAIVALKLALRTFKIEKQ